MEQNFDTSFIPKRPIFKEEGLQRHEPVPVVSLVGFAVFFAALILTGLAFFFHQKESIAVQNLSAQLATEKERFNPQAIEELKSMSARLKFAKQVIDNHVAASPVLDLVEDVTIKSVYYQGLTLAKDEKAGYGLKLMGKAPNYGLLYAQLEAFRAEPKIRDAEVRNIQLDEQRGEVTFEALLLLSPEVMKYTPAGAGNALVPPESISPEVTPSNP